MSIIFGTHIIYTVQNGDTLSGIAERFESTPEAIIQANSLYPPITDPGQIAPDQMLVIPQLAAPDIQTVYIVHSGDTLSQIAERYDTHPDMIAGISIGVQNPDFIFPQQPLWLPAALYEIEAGESLYSIANRLGISVSTLIQANQHRPGFSPDILYPEFRLIVPLPSSTNIVVLNPLPGNTIGDEHILQGYARAFEANVLHQVRDEQGNIVSEERFTTADVGAPGYGFFESTLPFDRNPATPTGEVWVYTRSARDGSIQDLVQTKVRFE